MGEDADNELLDNMQLDGDEDHDNDENDDEQNEDADNELLDNMQLDGDGDHDNGDEPISARSYDERAQELIKLQNCPVCHRSKRGRWGHEPTCEFDLWRKENAEWITRKTKHDNIGTY